MVVADEILASGLVRLKSDVSMSSKSYFAATITFAVHLPRLRAFLVDSISFIAIIHLPVLGNLATVLLFINPQRMSSLGKVFLTIGFIRQAFLSENVLGWPSHLMDSECSTSQFP